MDVQSKDAHYRKTNNLLHLAYHNLQFDLRIFVDFESYFDLGSHCFKIHSSNLS